MNELLALELEAGRLPLVDLDVLMLDWLDRMSTGPEQRDELWREHSAGLAANMTGALALMRGLLGEADWSVRAAHDEPGPTYRASIFAPAGAPPSLGRAPHEASALCAAIVRAVTAVEAAEGRRGFAAAVAAEDGQVAA